MRSCHSLVRCLNCHPTIPPIALIICLDSLIICFDSLNGYLYSKVRYLLHLNSTPGQHVFHQKMPLLLLPLAVFLKHCTTQRFSSSTVQPSGFREKTVQPSAACRGHWGGFLYSSIAAAASSSHFIEPSVAGPGPRCEDASSRGRSGSGSFRCTEGCTCEAGGRCSRLPPKRVCTQSLLVCCVCMYVYVYIYVHVLVHVSAFLCLLLLFNYYVYICVCMAISLCLCVYVCIHVYV